MFNLEAGATGADDALPARFAEERIPVAGEPRAVTWEAQDRMRRDYYAVRGWDEAGRPKPALVEELEIAPRPGRTP
jgi:aldehyde:ferredoxin oxidoreductase